MPIIELVTLPGLENAAALFGAAASQAAASDDIIVDIMVYIYDTMPENTLA